MKSDSYYMAVDIGGTKTAAALFTPRGEILDDIVLTVKSRTFSGEETVYQDTKNLLQDLLAGFELRPENLAGIGVGSPGPLDSKKGVIIHAPLMGWRNFPLSDRLRKDFGRPVALDNDGNLGALAEQRRGVAKGFQNVIYMTVSTGCGSGIVLNGEIYHGRNDGAGEIGHTVLFPEGVPCPCGSSGCFEQYASGTALNRTARQDLSAGTESLVLSLTGGDLERIDGKILLEAAEKGDPYARSLYEKEGFYLGISAANWFNLLDPDVLVLGGGVTKAKAFFYESMMRTFRERCIQPVNDDQIRFSEMNDRIVLYGAFYLISTRI